LIRNSLNKKVYVGATCGSLEARLKQHRYAPTALGRAIRRLGHQHFTIEQIDTATTKKELNKKELEMVKRHKKNSYNSKAKVDLVDTELKILSKEIHTVGGKELNIDLNEEWQNLYRKESVKGRQKIVAFLHSVKMPFILLKNVISHQTVIEV
jgi:hypothetical protein